jgi:release factor glutamine methyltransferase
MTSRQGFRPPAVDVPPLAGESKTGPSRLRCAIDSAAVQLADAGIDSARRDAEELAAHLAGAERGRLPLIEPPDDEFFERYHTMVAARSRRIPLQHLTGTAAFGPLTLSVGPGVFIPRPETEAMLEWVTSQCLPECSARPLIVDVCTGSGALAVALSQHWPAARVLGIDDSDTALDYARRNSAGAAVELRCADVTDPALLAELDGRVDLVVANPPYVPDGVRLAPEVSHHDPPHAVFGGPDGMTVIAAVVGLAGRWLRPGGIFAVEHDETTSLATFELISGTALFDNIVARVDLTGRPRFVTARSRGRLVRSAGMQGTPPVVGDGVDG